MDLVAQKDPFKGYICALIAVLFFGSNFTVVAKFDPGDGMFFQWILCVGIWSVGLIVQCAEGAPEFYPVAMAGGVIWCTGNCLTVFIIKRIGLGPGLVIWGTSGLIVGWFTGFFGISGFVNSEQDKITSKALNIAGLLVAGLALVASAQIKREAAPQAEARAHLQADQEDVREVMIEQTDLESSSERLKGVVAALCAGCCYGANFLPSTHIQEYYKHSSQNGLDYVFNQFCGILAASTVYFLIYCGIKGNKPQINPEIVLPGFVSGMMWAVAQTSWFVANANLGYTVAFPIILIGPGFIGSLWSVFLFKDIHGMKNYALLAIYFASACVSCLCTVMSKS